MFSKTAFLNIVQYMFYGASSFNQNLCSRVFPAMHKSFMFEGTSCPYELNDPPEYVCYLC